MIDFKFHQVYTIDSFLYSQKFYINYLLTYLTGLRIVQTNYLKNINLIYLREEFYGKITTEIVINNHQNSQLKCCHSS